MTQGFDKMMSQSEKIIEEYKSEINNKPYEEIRAWVIDGRTITKEVSTPSNEIFYREAYAFWDDKPEGAIRVFLEVIPLGTKGAKRRTRKKSIQTILKDNPRSNKMRR